MPQLDRSFFFLRSSCPAGCMIGPAQQVAEDRAP
jgi:hypothetical protein